MILSIILFILENQYHFLSVTYWPSTEPSIKRCTCVNKRNRCIRSKISEYPWPLNSVQMHTPTESRWMSNNYIARCHIWLELVSSSPSSSFSWSWSQLGDKMPAWESACRLRAWALGDPRLSSPAKMRKKCCYGQKNFGSNVAVCPRLQLTSHT